MNRAALLAIAVLCVTVKQQAALDSFSGRVAVVTGASSGIGRAIAIELVKRGMQVVGVARRVKPIEDLSASLADEPGKLYPKQCDVRVEKDVLSTFKWTEDNIGGVAILVNSAGVAFQGDTVNGSLGYWKEMLDTNVLGLSLCSREAIRSMIKYGIEDGQIIQLSSDAGIVFPYVSGSEMYAASKHAVTNLSEGLRRELITMNSTIRVTCVYPGLVNTPLLTKPGVFFTKEQLESSAKLEAIDIAQGVIYALNTPSNVQVVGLWIEPVGASF